MSYKRLDREDITISAEAVVRPAWTNQITTLTTLYTSSLQQADTLEYYREVYNLDPATASNAEIQLSVAYGHRYGSGSTAITSLVDGKSPSSLIYGQYRTLINGDENTDFTFGTHVPDDIFILNVDRSKYKERLKEGSLNLKLTSGSNSVQLTDNSGTITNNVVSYTDAGRVYDIVSGSNGTPFIGSGFTVNSGSYGKYLPDVGVIILNANALRGTVANGGISFVVNTASSLTVQPFRNTDEFYKIVDEISLQSEETVTSNYVFIRARNNDFNYSTNPSVMTSEGELRYSVLVNSPQTYVTTVGLYNDANELLAVAKLSRPLLKDFTREALFRVKLDF